jgi:hypothetical protein
VWRRLRGSPRGWALGTRLEREVEYRGEFGAVEANLHKSNWSFAKPRGTMKKTLRILLTAVAIISFLNTAEAQQTGKIFRIGYLDVSTASGSAVLVEAFRQELSKLGWIEGKNFNIEYRFAEQNGERLPELAADLVRLRVDSGRAPNNRINPTAGAR